MTRHVVSADSPSVEKPSLTFDSSMRCVTVQAPSRLHFGLFSWGGAGRQFGGVGVMVRDPGLELIAEAAEIPQFEGVTADRIRSFCEHWTHAVGLERTPSVHWKVVKPPQEHVGLGSGTQLGLAVAAALFRLHGIAQPGSLRLATSVGRGLRSAIGAHGFVAGGLLVEPGKFADEPLSPLEARVAVPEAWRVVLVRPRMECGLHGAAEKSAFAALPPVPATVSLRLRELALEQMAPAARDGDFGRFADSLWEYGTLAGTCFAPVQGGPFNGPVLTQLAYRLRELGAVGVGQSSWGPTLFAFQPSAETAQDFVRKLQSTGEMPVDVVVTSVANSGAVVSGE